MRRGTQGVDEKQLSAETPDLTTGEGGRGCRRGNGTASPPGVAGSATAEQRRPEPGCGARAEEALGRVALAACAPTGAVTENQWAQ